MNHCEPSPCNGGRCINTLVDFYCQCPIGRTGKRCELFHTYCGEQSCTGKFFNNFVDYHRHTIFVPTGIDICKTVPCKNGGKCTYVENGFACECLSGWSGKYLIFWYHGITTIYFQDLTVPSAWLTVNQKTAKTIAFFRQIHLHVPCPPIYVNQIPVIMVECANINQDLVIAGYVVYAQKALTAQRVTWISTNAPLIRVTVEERVEMKLGISAVYVRQDGVVINVR